MQIEEVPLSQTVPYAWDISGINGCYFWVATATVLMGDSRAMTRKVTVPDTKIFTLKDLPITPTQIIWFQAGAANDIVNLIWW